MENLGERIFCERKDHFLLFKIKSSPFSIVIYIVLACFMLYVKLYWLLIITILLSFVDYYSYEKIELDGVKNQLSKSSSLLLGKPRKQLIIPFDETSFVISSKYSFDGEAAVKDVYAIDVLYKGVKAFEFYRTSDLELIDKISKKLNTIQSLKWENCI
ncbi:hypothetical protein HUW51_22830 [Adhaeribacter swui]|uniref:Uncharacterized protein n=1 Tax=Adhaeribacter swui TaxID=2086471 RepID=A0A7G7GE25_9BACT|nr:hypothetical protein [Adhaeribacter swui]QNF35409.1 hypothetical protein HUW51_22830 [Adhaeribacter swui]